MSVASTVERISDWPTWGRSVALYFGLVALMAYVRLVLLQDRVVVLSYGVPLLVCLWHRDRRLLWALTVTFAVMAYFKAIYLLPVRGEVTATKMFNVSVHWLNLFAVAGTVHAVVALIDRLDGKRRELELANTKLSSRQEEIGRQNEELNAQAEELAHQNEQIQQQSEELQQQGEELAAQKEELQEANELLLRREAMLQTMLQALHVAGRDEELPQRLCEPLLVLFAEVADAVAIVECRGDSLSVLAQHGRLALGRVEWPLRGTFAEIIMGEGRTGSVEDLDRRPDLMVPHLPGHQFRSVLATPLRVGGQIVGAIKIYAVKPRAWSNEEFHMLEWVSAQCTLILECHRLRAQLAEKNRELDSLVRERTAQLQEIVNDLEHFSYAITHDLRAPLRAMHGFSAMLAEECDGRITPTGLDYLRRIATAAARMDRLITDALSYSGAVRQEFSLVSVDIGQLLRGIVESYPNLQPPLATVTLRGEFPPVMGNEAALTQCFANLLGNAAKFVAPGRVAEVRVHAERRGEWVRVWFEDDGIGIPEAMVSRLFGMFQRLSKDYEGTGIGLALVKKVAERLGGSVGVDSKLGQGSRFWLDLKGA